MNDRALNQIISLTCVFVLSACGGGSGGSQPPTTSPAPPPADPPPANDPPTFVASVPASIVFEGRVIEIRARETADPDGDYVQFEVTQQSGLPATLLENLGGQTPTYYFEAPDLAIPGSTEILIFEVAGADAYNDPVTHQVTVTVRDNDRPGLSIAQIEPDDLLFAEAYASFINRKSTVWVHMLRPNGSAAEIGKIPEGVDDSFASYAEALGTMQFHPTDVVLYDALSFNGVDGPIGEDFIVLSSDRDALEWYSNDVVYDDLGRVSFTPVHLQQSEYFNDPCTAVQRTDTGNDLAWIGLREGGVVVTEVAGVQDADGNTSSFVLTRLQTVGAGRSLCFVFPTSLPTRFNPAGGVPLRLGLITVDFLNKELLLVADSDEDGTWEELDVVPLDVGDNADLEIIDVLAHGSPSLVPRSITVLVSDGVDGGDHRLIIVAQGQDDLEIYQETYRWSGGPPIKLLRGPFAGDATQLYDRAGNQFRQDLAVVSASETGNVVLRNVTSPDSTAFVPVYAPPEPIPFLSGASSAITANYFLDGAVNYARFGIVATFPEDRSLRFFGLEME